MTRLHKQYLITELTNTFLILCFIFLFACNKDDNASTNPIEQLTPATQTGEGTFGCLVNGKPFVETGTYFNCYYQLVDGAYYFSISAEEDNHSILRQVRLASNHAEIQNGSLYTLSCNEPSYYYGEVSFANQILGADTCESSFGKLSITKMDFLSHIVSGTFEFDIVHPTTGDIIEIRHGRFDTVFTQ